MIELEPPAVHRPKIGGGLKASTKASLMCRGFHEELATAAKR